MPTKKIDDPYKFKRNEPLFLDSEYKVVRIINRGGSAVVYHVNYRGMDRAVKILSPRKLDPHTHPEELDPKEWAEFATNFTDEVKFLMRLSHPNIARIIDHGVCGGGKVVGRPFYAMELIEGPPFVEALTDAKKSAAEVLRLIDELLEAMTYLHDQMPHVMHMDIKSDNVLVRSIHTRLQAVLVDVGVAKVVHEEEERTTTTYRTTRKNTREERKHLVDKPVPRSFIKSIYPDEDLFQFGGLLKEILDVPSVREKVLSDLDEAGRSALYLFLNRLRGPQKHQYGSVREVRSYFQKLFPNYAAPMGVPELATSIGAVKHIAIPGGRIKLNRRIADIVNSPIFQRLQRLHQLNFIYLILPGAQHSRFLHSLHTYALCREYVWALLDDARFRLAASAADLEAVLLYALLHDVGHYPLSHMFEDYHAQQERHTASPDALSDDQVLECLLFPDSVTDAVKGTVAEMLTSLFVERGIPPLHSMLKSFHADTIKRLHQLLLPLRPDDHIGKVLKAIIDSPIDVDKGSYLTIDSLMTGINYGGGIDLEGLLSGLRYPSEADIVKNQSAVLAITDKGLSAAESLILARYWMIKRVYWHHTNRAVMTMVKFVVSSLREVGALDFSDYLKTVFFGSDRAALRHLCNLWDDNKLKIDTHYGGNAINPAGTLLSGHRTIYKRLLTISREASSVQGDAYNRIGVRSDLQRFQICKAISTAVGNFLEGGAPCPGSILIDVPDKERERSTARLLLYRRRTDLRVDANESQPEEEDVGRSLFEASPIIAALKEEFDQYTKKCRVFLAPHLYKELEESRKLDDARMAARAALFQAVGVTP
jgi:HD superfamily phosphohydrolase